MIDLEYKVGGLDINPEGLKFEGDDSNFANHKFVVEGIDGVLSIYIAERRRHKAVADKFDLNSRWSISEICYFKVVGGGSCYLNNDSQLVLDNYSEACGAISREAAQEFAELMLPELQKQGIQINGINVNPDEHYLRWYWKEKAFDFK